MYSRGGCDKAEVAAAGGDILAFTAAHRTRPAWRRASSDLCPTRIVYSADENDVGPRPTAACRRRLGLDAAVSTNSLAGEDRPCEHPLVVAGPVLHLTVGLPGAGKTTWARSLADEEGILRLTPDEWMAPLFNDSDADGRRDILEGRMIWVAQEVLNSGASVILDFGCWSPEERYAIRAIAESAGALFTLHHLSIDEQERRKRATRRWKTAPETTFPMTDDDHDQFLALCKPPSAAELSNAPIPPAPAGYEDWFDWASRRWPTLPRFNVA